MKSENREKTDGPAGLRGSESRASRPPCERRAGFDNIIGTTTSVADSSGIPDLIIQLGQQLRRERGDQKRVQRLYREFAERKRSQSGQESQQERFANSPIPGKTCRDKTKGYRQQQDGTEIHHFTVSSERAKTFAAELEGGNGGLSRDPRFPPRSGNRGLD